MALAAEIRASNEDFWDSGWSRGHMAPAGNNKVLNRRESQKSNVMLLKIVFSALPEIDGRHLLALQHRAAGRGQQWRLLEPS